MKTLRLGQKMGDGLVKDEQGFIMVMALMMLAILSIMGSAAMMVRNTEQQITVNTEVLHHNFFAVEAVTLEGAARISKEIDLYNDKDPAALFDPLNFTTFPSWMGANSAALDLSKSNQWPSPTIAPENTTLTGVADITPNGYASDGTSAGDRIWYAVEEGPNNGRCEGTSLTQEDKVEMCYNVYGMYDVKSGVGKAYSGRRLLNVGYKKVVYF